MTKRRILDTIRRSGAMYADELGGNHAKLWDMTRDGLLMSSRSQSGKYLYVLTQAGRQRLDDRRTFWRGFLIGLAWPVLAWRRLFK